MRLEACAAEIRPRRPWEAVDLGCALVRRWIGPLFRSWLVTVLPISLLVWGACWYAPILGVFILWWMRPIFERVPLFIISRSLFGEVPRVRTVLKVWPSLLVRPFWLYWLGIRFTAFVTRSLHMPLRDLERIGGEQYRQRARLLARHAGSTASWLTFSAMLIELMLMFGIIGLVFFLTPDVFLPPLETVQELFLSGGPEAVPTAVYRIAGLVYIVAGGIIQTVYIGAGFGLYLNSRSHVEGWDIELRFRRLTNRVRPAAAAALLLVALAFSAAPEVQAQGFQGSGDPETHMEEVLADPDFEVHTRIIKTRQYQQKQRSGSMNLQGLGYVLTVLVALLAIGLVIYWIVQAASSTSMGSGAALRQDSKAPSQVMGMNIAPESLPEDIVSAARRLWREGQAHEAVGLLYRGSISYLVNRAALEIRDSDTESDCVRRARDLADTSKVGYFNRLTKTWIRTAYASRDPDEAAMEELCENWPFGRMRA